LGHIPVLLDEVVHLLAWKHDGIYVDCTLGGGGHCKAILETVPGQTRIIGLDWDARALEEAHTTLLKWASQVNLNRINFIEFPAVLDRLGIKCVDGFLFDLGLSRYQIDDPVRGFSFMNPGPLDMRMDTRLTTTAAHLVNALSADALEDNFRQYGEERFARRIAQRIVEYRKKKKIRTTQELSQIIAQVKPWRGKLNPATQVFQALRIAVNYELDNLKRVLELVPGYLSIDGRLVVISYHSLEDRIVKQFIRNSPDMQPVNRKVIRPEQTEIENNPSSRSARLRAAVHITASRRDA
jgi:16S rRNA (cytosine1402-N4)-methyltransferase